MYQDIFLWRPQLNRNGCSVSWLTDSRLFYEQVVEWGWAKQIWKVVASVMWIYVFKSMYTHVPVDDFSSGLITGIILSKILTFKLSSSVYDCHYSDVRGNLNVDKIGTVSVPLSLIHQLKYFLSCICTRKNYFLFTKMHLKIYSVKWRPFRPGGNELKHYGNVASKSLKNKWLSWRTNSPIYKNNVTRFFTQ